MSSGLQKRLRDISGFETVRKLLIAADRWALVGGRLVSEQQWHAAVYLLGYSAELTLKHAYFTWIGVPSTELAPLPLARVYGKKHFPMVDPKSFHSLRWWTRLISHHRRAAGQPLPAGFEGDLTRRTRRLYANWTVQMRYRLPIATAGDARVVYHDVRWLRRHSEQLWSPHHATAEPTA